MYSLKSRTSIFIQSGYPGVSRTFFIGLKAGPSSSSQERRHQSQQALKGGGFGAPTAPKDLQTPKGIPTGDAFMFSFIANAYVFTPLMTHLSLNPDDDDDHARFSANHSSKD